MGESLSLHSKFFSPTPTVYCEQTTDRYQVVIGVCFGVAMITATGRIIVRLRFHKTLRLDDFFLLFSCVFLVAATGVLYYGTPSIYFGAKLIFDPAAVVTAGVNEAEILHQANLISRIDWSYLAISWVAIFLVKFGFLSLFRHLVDRLPPMFRFWKGVVVFTGLVFVFCVCDGFIACSKQGPEAGKGPNIIYPAILF